MKPLLSLLLLLVVSSLSFAQSPQKMSYQAVIRDELNQLVTNTTVHIRFSILQGAHDGPVIYTESQHPRTNANGLITLAIGKWDDFGAIPWDEGPFFVKTEIDPKNGIDYTIVGVSQLLSVPYALHAATATQSLQAEEDPLFQQSVASSIQARDTASWNQKLDAYTETDPRFAATVAAGIGQADTAYWNRKLDHYAELDPLFKSSLAAKIHEKDTIYWNQKLDEEHDPYFQVSLAHGITSSDTAYWNKKLDGYVEKDPRFAATVAAGITERDTSYWNQKLNEEHDPYFQESLAQGITSSDTAYWNKKLDGYVETDPRFAATVAASISEGDTSYWNQKLDAEHDPYFRASLAQGITPSDTAYWNNKLDGYVETDPIFAETVAAGISEGDTAYWNQKLDEYTELDPLFGASVASAIDSTDTTYWNRKLDVELDPLFHLSTAAGISEEDTSKWHNKSEFDGEYTSLEDAPSIANSVPNKTIRLNTNDGNSSLTVTNNSGANVFKVDGTGRMSGDGSGLSHVRPMAAYVGGAHRHRVESISSFDLVRSVKITVPGPGIFISQASGFVSWESAGFDVVRLAILVNQDPNTSWAAEREFYDYLNVLTDYNTTDPTDQLTSFSQHRGYRASGGGTYTFYLWANKYIAAANVLLGNVNMSVMYFPTGGTGG